MTPLRARVILGAEGSVTSARKTPRHCEEDGVLEFFVEDPRLNLKGRLGAEQLALEPAQSCRGHGSDPYAVGHGSEPGSNGEDGDNADEHPCAKAAGAHGRDLAIRGQTAETNEDSDEQAHGNGDGAGDRQGEEEEFGNTGQGSAVADDDFEQPSQVPHENYEREQRNADGGVLYDFVKNVARKNLHGATGNGTFV